MVKRSLKIAICEISLGYLLGIERLLEFEIGSTPARLHPTPVAFGVLSVYRFHVASLAGLPSRYRKNHGLRLWFELHRLYSFCLIG